MAEQSQTAPHDSHDVVAPASHLRHAVVTQGVDECMTMLDVGVHVGVNWPDPGLGREAPGAVGGRDSVALHASICRHGRAIDAARLLLESARPH